MGLAVGVRVGTPLVAVGDFPPELVHPPIPIAIGTNISARDRRFIRMECTVLPFASLGTR